MSLQDRRTSSTDTGRCSSADSEVRLASRIPHGTIRSNHDRSQSQLRAKPCIVTPRDANADGRDLAVLHVIAAADPHPTAPRHPLRLESHLSADVDEHLLHPAHIGDHVDRVLQRDDRVADQLSGTVPGDLAAPVHVDYGRAVDGPSNGSVRRPAV